MRMMIFSCLLALSPFHPALAQGAVHADVPAATDVITVMDAVVVSGVQPGPGMWKVSRAGHVLWVLGVQSPLPRKMEWRSPEVEAAIAGSQEVLDQPGVSIGMSAGGIFRALFAMPTLLSVRKLPDGKTLHDVLPADLYARWSQLKPRYLGGDKDVEQWRPMFAAQALYDAAIGQAGLESAGAVAAKVTRLAKQHDLPLTSTSLSAIVTHPKALAKSFVKSPIDDVGCFRATLDRLDSDVATAVARANAWAVGDVEEMARLTPPSDMRSCAKAVTEAEAARSLGLDNAEAKLEVKWLAAAEAALARNQSSFAMLSVPHLLSARSYLAKLAARGYTVEAPQ